MHAGVREFIRWLTDDARSAEEAKLNPPAKDGEIAVVEQLLGGPLPTDLRLVLHRFNGGSLPNGELLPAGIEPGSIGATIRDYADTVGLDFLDSELLLPFFKTPEGSWLAFDRSAGPVADTWNIVDYYPETDDHSLTFRTFDGWCRFCVAEWTADDFGNEFSLDTYLASGRRHASVEPDVATPHATVAHAYRRAGKPEESLESYLNAARCVPALEWCDWEALKIAKILELPDPAYEAASRLCRFAPEERWELRECYPGMVAEVIGPVAKRDDEPTRWLRLLDMLTKQADEEDAPVIRGVRDAIVGGTPLPPVRPIRDEPPVPQQPDVDAWWKAAEYAYAVGSIRDDDIALGPELARLGRVRPLANLLRIRRDF